MKLRKLISFYLVCLLAVVSNIAFSNECFASEVNPYALKWAENNKLISKNINESEFITRGEMAEYLVKCFGSSADADISVYTDIEENDSNYDYIRKAVGSGYMSGNGNMFRAGDYMTRQEAAVAICRGAKFEADKTGLAGIKDSEIVAVWAEGSVGKLLIENYIKAEIGYFRPLDKAETSTVIEVLYNISTQQYGDRYKDAGLVIESDGSVWSPIY